MECNYKFYHYVSALSQSDHLNLLLHIYPLSFADLVYLIIARISRMQVEDTSRWATLHWKQTNVPSQENMGSSFANHSNRFNNLYFHPSGQDDCLFICRFIILKTHDISTKMQRTNKLNVWNPISCFSIAVVFPSHMLKACFRNRQVE